MTHLRQRREHASKPREEPTQPAGSSVEYHLRIRRGKGKWYMDYVDSKRFSYSGVCHLDRLPHQTPRDVTRKLVEFANNFPDNLEFSTKGVY